MCGFSALACLSRTKYCCCCVVVFLCGLPASYPAAVVGGGRRGIFRGDLLHEWVQRLMKSACHHLLEHDKVGNLGVGPAKTGTLLRRTLMVTRERKGIYNVFSLRVLRLPPPIIEEPITYVPAPVLPPSDASGDDAAGEVPFKRGGRIKHPAGKIFRLSVRIAWCMHEGGSYCTTTATAVL